MSARGAGSDRRVAPMALPPQPGLSAGHTINRRKQRCRTTNPKPLKHKAMKKNRLYFLLVLALLIHASAHAHPPYLLKQGVITDPDGNQVIKEKLYGDGVLFPDPGTFQLRNRHGALLANSPIEDHVASFCPSLNFCWVFPCHVLSLFAVGWSLDTEALVFDKPAPNYEFKNAAKAEAFKSYLNDPLMLKDSLPMPWDTLNLTDHIILVLSRPESAPCLALLLSWRINLYSC